MKKYLQLDFSSAQFFEYSKTEQEGFEKHTSSKGNVSYRQSYFEGVTGKLESVYLHDGLFGKEIRVSLKNGDINYIAQIGVANQRGNVDSNFAEGIIKALPSLNIGDEVNIRAYNFIPEDSKYAKIGISVKVGGEKVKGLTNTYRSKESGKIVQGDIPMIEWKENALGKNRPTASSVEARDNYLLEVLKFQTERLKGAFSSNSQSQNIPATKSAPLEKEKLEDPLKNKASVNTDDLPF